MWPVLLVQWALVVIVGLGSWFALATSLGRKQKVVLWSGVMITVAILLYPPHRAYRTGPLALGPGQVVHKLLWSPAEASYIRLGQLSVRTLTAISVTWLTIVRLGKKAKHQPRRDVMSAAPAPACFRS